MNETSYALKKAFYNNKIKISMSARRLKELQTIP
jgi:hypothetical protein